MVYLRTSLYFVLGSTHPHALQIAAEQISQIIEAKRHKRHPIDADTPG
jgi:hypothetical protein